ncbi:MAG: ABC transporter permease [Stellaceae bacterium]
MTIGLVPKRGWRNWLSSDAPATRTQASIGRVWRGGGGLLREPAAMTGGAIVLLAALLAIAAPLLAPNDPVAQNLARRLLPPGAVGHLLGTDELGRDILSRLLWGARVTLGIVALVSVVTAPIGLVIGVAAGYAGGFIEAALMRVTDVFLALPRLILALAFVAALGPGIENAVLAIAIVAWPPYARVARAETLVLRRAEFIEAARMAGASPWRLVLRHVLPLCLPSVVVRMSLDMAGVILIAAGLGFLGLGAQPPTPEWGAMIATGRDYMLDHWWVAAMPGIAIAVLSLGFNLLGDGMRDWLDPKRS